MLLRLSITNYALIDHLEWEPGDGLNVITGETGAGKSILLGALGLILGERAESTKKKCIIEGRFKGERSKFKGWFQEKDLDFAEEIILRREIGADGRSRAFINDTPVTLQVLRELGDQLVDIHSQHETLFLTRTDFQTEVLDLVAGNEKKLNEFDGIFRTWKKDLSELQQREEELTKQMQEKDFLEFQLNELEEVDPGSIDQLKLEQDVKEQEYASEVRKGLNDALAILSAESRGVIAALHTVKSILKQVSDKSRIAADLLQRTESSLEEIKDIGNDIERGAESVVHDPEKAERTQEKLDRLYHLQQKHRVQDTLALVNLMTEFRKKLENAVVNSGAIEELRKKCAEQEEKLLKLSEDLRKQRKKGIPALQEEVHQILKDLAMPRAEVRITIDPLTQLSSHGMDKVRFLFSANPGSDPMEISKVASGGELSRLMLALKSIIAKRTALPTIIFDEIDSGVSGGVAAKMAEILHRMGKTMQVVAITHLPQLAGKGESHFKVYKENKGNGTQTKIAALSAKERIEEVASMLSTGKPTENALKTARELLSR